MRRVLLVLVGVLALIGAACGGDDQFREGEGSKDIETAGISVKASGPSSVRGNVVSLDVAAEGVRIVKADGNTSGATGHFHVFIDREPVRPGAEIPREAGIVHSADDPVVLTGLTQGRHEFHVVLGDGTHKRIGSAEATVETTVRGPSVDASVPASIAADQPFDVDVAVEGVELVKAEGDTSGKTGHLHLFIDKEPDLDAPIPVGDPAIIHSATAPIAVTGLASGEHTLWVVLGNGAHVPFDPPVMEKLTITVP